ncbi:MAG: calcium-binding protein [Xanthobacteraceae bacterium]
MSTIDWLNTSGGNFATASDWNLDRVPLPSDDVEIDATGSYVVTSSASETIASLAIGSLAVLEVSGGNFTVSGAISVTYVIGVDPGAGLYVGGAVSGSATLDNLGGFMEFDSSVTSLIDFDTDQGGEALLAGSGSFTIMTAYNGGNAVVLDSSSAQSVVAGGGGAYDFYDEGSANDYIGNTGNMSVAKNLGSGADQFYFVGNQNQLFGGSAGGWMGVGGNDNALVGSSGSYWIGATGSSNTLVAGSGSTTLYADGNGNYLYAGSGQDWEGVSGNSNQIYGGPGADWMGASGNDNALSAGTGNSTLSADGNSNTLSGGGGGNDWIGVSGNGNYLYGGAGNDYLAATGNNNVLNPNGAGTDTLDAGAHSNDQFVYHPGDGNVTIDNFKPSSGDVIDFAGWGITSVGQLGPYVSTSSDGSIMLNLGGHALTLEGIPGGLQNSWFNFHA